MLRKLSTIQKFDSKFLSLSKILSLSTLSVKFYTRNENLKGNRRPSNDKVRKSGSQRDQRNYKYQAIKAYAPSRRDNIYENSLVVSKEERRNVNRIIENPDDSIKLDENDIHSALMQVGKLPELEMKNIIANGIENKISNESIFNEINVKILSKLNLSLNKSLVEICKIGKNNPEIFRQNEHFWVTLQNEIMTRQDSLSNTQITDIISSFSKCELTKKITIFESMEDIILDSPLPFQISQYEKLFYAYSKQKKGSTAFLKIMSRKFFKYKDINDSWKMAKFYVELNSHHNSIRGNFDHLKDLEDQIKVDIESGRIKFDQLISLAHYLFSDNLGSNDIQRLIENALIEKFENRIEVDMSHVIKLVKSLSNYYIKNDNLCDKIKNYLETYLNSTINRENEAQPSGGNFNLDFNEQYMKLVTQLNILVWSFSKNKIFVNLNKNDEFKYFYSRLSEMFLKNIEYYNSRELAFSLEGLLILNGSNKFPFSPEEVVKINKKILSLENINNHDTVKFLKIFIRESDMLKSITTFEKLIDLGISSYNKMTYQELIDFTDLIYDFSTQFEKHFNYSSKNFNILEEKLNNPNILPRIDIVCLCKLLNMISKPLMNFSLNKEFIDAVEKILKVRINEIPKEQFCQILSSSVKLKMTEVVENLISILEDLSHFENLQKCFDKPKQRLDILWTFLSIYHRKNWSLKLTHKQSNFVEENLRKFINIDEGNLQNEFIENFMKTQMNVDLFIGGNLHNKEDTYSRYLQTIFLSFLYLKDIHNLSESESKYFLENIKREVFNYSLKFDMNARSNFISLDPASKCDKEVIEDLEKEVVNFFKRKVNTTIYPNFIDEFLNPVNILVYFELPKLNADHTVSGIDSEVFSIVVLNKSYYNKHNELSVLFENRLKVLKEILNFEVLIIKEEEWKDLMKEGNNSSNTKMEYLKNLFGYDMNLEDNLKTKVIKKQGKSDTQVEQDKSKSILVDSKKKRLPKFKLTENLIK